LRSSICWYRLYTLSRNRRVEKAIYRLIGVDPEAEQAWGPYARSVQVFSFVGVLAMFALQLLQDGLPPARQGHTPDAPGTLPTPRSQFVGLVAAVTVILCALTFLPALAHGPLAEGIH
jgi:K+-transporting ATPase A subunit